MTKKTSYGRIKGTTIGGFFMPRSYRHIKEYETVILSLKEEGKTNQEICERLGFEIKHIVFYQQNWNLEIYMLTVVLNVVRVCYQV